jgi:phosphoribosylanthranilate isomerase
MKVKICGITNKTDALWAVNYGADYLGLNLYKKSPRHVSVANAAKWASQMPAFATMTGVFVDESAEAVLHAVNQLNLKLIQLHGDETPEIIRHLRLTLESAGKQALIMKAFRIQDRQTLDAIPPFLPCVDYLLLDSFNPDRMGGTGGRFDWDLAIAAKDFGKPIFLAGGLAPENVREAVKKVGPYAVDVATGVEKSPKRKDLRKLQEFIVNAKK